MIGHKSQDLSITMMRIKQGENSHQPTSNELPQTLQQDLKQKKQHLLHQDPVPLQDQHIGETKAHKQEDLLKGCLTDLSNLDHQIVEIYGVGIQETTTLGLTTE